MALKPINKRMTNCSDLSKISNSYSSGMSIEDQEKQSFIDSWNMNIGITKVYRNFDFTKSYEMIISEGKFEDDELPYKKFQLAPFYNEWILNVGDYISFEYRGRMTTMLISTLDGQYQYKVRGRMYNCNNTLHLVDDYGYVHNYPIVFNDKAQRTDFFYSPSGTIQNGRVELDVQYDEYTSNIKMNNRYMFGGIVYKVTYVSVNMNQFFDTNDGVVTLMMIIDEKSNEDDDIENNLTNVSLINKYQLVCETDEIKGNVGNIGDIIAFVIKDGIKCDEEVVYEIIQENESSDTETCNKSCHYWYAECPSEEVLPIDYVINVDENGHYELKKLGNCQVKVYMKNNPDKYKIINVTVDERAITVQESIVK